MAPTRTWTDEKIKSTLQEIIDETGSFPRRVDLQKRGLVKLHDAIKRYGGVEHWQNVMQIGKSPNLQTRKKQHSEKEQDLEDKIREKAYFLSLEFPHQSQIQNWEQAKAELK